MIRRIIHAALLIAIGSVAAHAASVTGSFSVFVQQQALAMTMTPASATIACNAAAGTVAATLSTVGGDGNAVTYSLTGASNGDFVIGGAGNAQIIVGASGINTADCGKTQNITVTASQP
jgi:hypothetical protein